jgi:hypothetical protein
LCENQHERGQRNGNASLKFHGGDPPRRWRRALRPERAVFVSS